MKTKLMIIGIICFFVVNVGCAHFAKDWEKKATKYEWQNNCYNKAKQYAQVWSDAGYEVNIVYGYDKSTGGTHAEAWALYEDEWVALTEYESSQLVYFRADNGASFVLLPFVSKNGTKRIGPTQTAINTVTHVENYIDLKRLAKTRVEELGNFNSPQLALFDK